MIKVSPYYQSDPPVADDGYRILFLHTALRMTSDLELQNDVFKCLTLGTNDDVREIVESTSSVFNMHFKVNPKSVERTLSSTVSSAAANDLPRRRRHVQKGRPNPRHQDHGHELAQCVHRHGKARAGTKHLAGYFFIGVTRRSTCSRRRALHTLSTLSGVPATRPSTWPSSTRSVRWPVSSSVLAQTVMYVSALVAPCTHSLHLDQERQRHVAHGHCR